MTSIATQSDPPADPGCLPLDALRRLVPVDLPPELLSEAVVRVADAIRADGALDRLPVLADALEDAGCTDELLLAHCRAGDPHRPDCWVVELVREAIPQPSPKSPPTPAEIAVRSVDAWLDDRWGVASQADAVGLFRSVILVVFVPLTVSFGLFWATGRAVGLFSVVFFIAAITFIVLSAGLMAWFRVTRSVRR